MTPELLIRNQESENEVSDSFDEPPPTPNNDTRTPSNSDNTNSDINVNNNVHSEISDEISKKNSFTKNNGNNPDKLTKNNSEEISDDFDREIEEDNSQPTDLISSFGVEEDLNRAGLVRSKKTDIAQQGKKKSLPNGGHQLLCLSVREQPEREFILCI